MARETPTGATAAHRSRRSVVLFFLAVLLLPPGVAGNGITAEPPETLWSLDLARLQEPYSLATSLPVLVLSDDGHTLVAGTDNGGVLFLNATTGKELAAWETTDHGAVVAVRLDATGTLAAVRYTDGYLAVVSRDAEEALFTLYSESGAPIDERPFLAAALSTNGRFLVVTGDAVRLYYREAGPEARFHPVGEVTGTLGPYVLFLKGVPAFGAVAPDGRVTIFTYSSQGLRVEGSRDILDRSEIVALAVSGEGNRFAVATAAGDLMRYTPSLNPEAPQLIPDYQGRINGKPAGLALNGDGERLAAWSDKEILWTSGCSVNSELCNGRKTEENTVRLRPPFGARFADAAPTPDLSRVVVQVDGDEPLRKVYNLPSLDEFTLTAGASAMGGALLGRDGATIYMADGAKLRAREVRAEELPPGGVQIDDGEGPEGSLLGLSTEVLLYAGMGLLALVILVVVVSVVLAARRQSGPADVRPLGTLAHAPEEPFHTSTTPAPSGALASVPGHTRPVVSSAPIIAPPPEGHLVLQGVEAHGEALVSGLDLAVRRAEVLRVHGPAQELSTLASLLGGHTRFSGLVAVGGASAHETPVLFQRRVRVGLDDASVREETAAERFQKTAAARGLPAGLVARRLEKDLGWMGARLHRPWTTLRPLDQWKVRLALALVDRPHVLVLGTEGLPLVDDDGQRVATLRRVLSGVARQYDTLVVLLDDRRIDPLVVRRLSDEEVGLRSDGFHERLLLEDGRPVKASTASAASKDGTTRRRRR